MERAGELGRYALRETALKNDLNYRFRCIGSFGAYSLYVCTIKAIRFLDKNSLQNSRKEFLLLILSQPLERVGIIQPTY